MFDYRRSDPPGPSTAGGNRARRRRATVETRRGRLAVVAGAVLFLAATSGYLALRGGADASDARRPAKSPEGQETVDVPRPLEDQRISVGGSFICASGLDSGSGIRCWGYGLDGGIGDGALEDAIFPTSVDFPEGQEFTQISAGGSHACALSGSGEVWCWGGDAYGQLGIDPSTPFERVARPTAALIPAGVDIVQVSSGGRHTCALAGDGTAWCWGEAALGQIGNGFTDVVADQLNLVPVPVTMPEGHSFAGISAGWQHTCALGWDGSAWCWGSNEHGQLGNGGTDTRQDRPVRVAAPEGVVLTQISAGSDETCALTSDGSAWCWGSDQWGQLGDGCEPSDGACPDARSPVRVEIPPGLTFTSISVGSGHVCALASDDSAWCWGNNASGFLGTGVEPGPGMVYGDAQGAPTAVQMPEGARFTEISAGGWNTCAADVNTGLWCWGSGVEYGVGDGELTDRWAPVKVWPLEGPEQIVDASCGSESCAGIWRTSAGALVFEAWGMGDYWGVITVCVEKVTRVCRTMAPEEQAAGDFEWRLPWGANFPAEGSGVYRVTMTTGSGDPVSDGAWDFEWNEAAPR